MDIGDERRTEIWQEISRRAVLAGGAGAGAAALLATLPLAPAANAAADSDAAAGAVTAGGPAAGGPASLPVAVAGAVMRTVHAVTFNPAGLSAGASLVGTFPPFQGAWTANGVALFTPLDVPTGGKLKQIDCYAYATNGTPPAGVHWVIESYDSQGGSSSIGQVQPPTGPGITQTTFGALNIVNDGLHAMVADLSPASSTYYALAVTYQYLPPPTPGGLVVLDTPLRLYDSRPGFPPATGPKAPLTNATTRVINTAVAGGPPGGAKAVLVNVTATGTSAAGFFGLFRQGIAWPGTSSLNWDHASQTIANQSVVALNTVTGQFSIYCAGQADIVIDLIGYYL